MDADTPGTDPAPGVTERKAAAGRRESANEKRRRRLALGTAARREMPLWKELPLLLLVAFCVAVLIRTFFLQAFGIPSASMEQILTEGDRVLVSKVVYQVRTPQRGEVIVFRGNDRWAPEFQSDPNAGLLSRIGGGLADLVGIGEPGEKDFIKRVIGRPGDTVMCCDADGRVTVNGYPLDESEYLFEDSPRAEGGGEGGDCRTREFGPVLVPEGQLFVMGDHRGRSQDSRCQGFVPMDNVIGRAIAVVWPVDRWHALPLPATFAGVPDPASGTGGSAPIAAGGGQGGPVLLAPIILTAVFPAPRFRFNA
ncbi:signal peptidase I [Phytomonospora sp. NPDC050363]|uniref:signal peptidase I n=1 Tax=Phytomonospora sp. NPDC050363 TaxID=3155642 RepID=UPI0033C01238